MFRTRLGLAGLALGLLLVLMTAIAGSATTYYEPGATGYDVSYLQCSARLPRDGDFAIVGVTRGLPWSANPCIRTQFQWASGLEGEAGFYMNTANPGPISPYWRLAGPRPCIDQASYEDAGCAYNYGWNAASYAFDAAKAATSASAAAGHYWWLDVETMNSWNGSQAANAAAVRGYLDLLLSKSVVGVGIYSTGYQWNVITGGLSLQDVPSWVAGASSAKTAARYCGTGFTGGRVWLVQYQAKGFDANLVCPATSASASTKG